MPRSRNFALTWNLERYTLEQFVDNVDLVENYLSKVKGYTIGAIETGSQNDYEHCHILLSFVNPVELSSVIDYYKGIHVECVNSYKSYRNYMKKEGSFICDTLGNSSNDEDILDDLISCENFKEFLRLHPEVIRSIDKYEKAFNHLNERM